MSAAPKESITKDMMKELKSRNRGRFSDEQVKRALKYQYDNECTLEEAAQTEGMSGQTLAARRDKLAIEMGVAAPKVAKK